jgi:predicted alternative tryptophan synthase beta-subunit
MQTRFDLTQADIPKSWYNLLADFAEPLPPPLHPGMSVVTQAGKARETGKKSVLLFNLSGHGLLDLAAYESYLHGKLPDV